MKHLFFYLLVLLMAVFFISCSESNTNNIDKECSETCKKWERCSTKTGLCESNPDFCAEDSDCKDKDLATCNLETNTCISTIIVNTCEGVNCGEHGNCVVTDNIIECKCNEGYHPEQLNCVKNSIYQIDVKMPVGMNLPGLNYYTTALIFTDVMTTASKLITFHDGSGWDTGKFDQLSLDENGYPNSIPQNIDGEDTVVRFMLNNYYTGKFYYGYILNYYY